MVKAGYKQTEVGEIPEDWETKEIRQVCKLINGRGFKPHEWKRSGLPIIRIQNLNGSDEFNYYDGLYDRKLEVNEGQLLFAWSGSRGTSFGPHVWKGDRGLLNYHTWKVVTDNDAISGEYFLYALRNLTASIEEKAHGASALVHTQKWEMEGYKFPAPKEPAEQMAIAAALSDVDTLIASLEKLIEKKRDIKTATMQQLLTGKKRLVNFGGEWTPVSIGRHAYLKARIGWQALTTNEYLEFGDYQLVTGTDFKNGRIDWAGCWYVSEWRYSQDKNIQLMNGDVLITKDGTIGKVGYVEDLSIPATLNSGVFVIRPINNSFHPIYLYYVLSSRIFRDFLDEITAGSTITHLYQKDFVGFEFSAPCIEEQKLIAEVLGDIDRDIIETENRLAKTKAIKQGMMQELLTGRTRLV